ncbi:unnamed protein product [Nesidiocoris tenuis]|uniref:Uncharacterized protein n=1 Tax=Nesidiocoris tenuis TaxID=355587 RepID=A0A6H5HAS4_9HEMI|nr:unnamed protein product [Nesidiocoris tenuis]
MAGVVLRGAAVQAHGAPCPTHLVKVSFLCAMSPEELDEEEVYLTLGAPQPWTKMRNQAFGPLAFLGSTPLTTSLAFHFCFLLCTSPRLLHAKDLEEDKLEYWWRIRWKKRRSGGGSCGVSDGGRSGHGGVRLGMAAVNIANRRASNTRKTRRMTVVGGLYDEQSRHSASMQVKNCLPDIISEWTDMQAMRPPQHRFGSTSRR